MYLVISGGLVLVNAAVWIVLLRLLWRERGEKWHWKIEASTYLSRARTWQAQAEAFEAAGKTLEEHVAAERGRAARLAEARQDSEDRCEQLQAELNELRRATSAPPADKEAPAFTAAIDARELANVMNYNGTAEGQVDLNDE